MGRGQVEGLGRVWEPPAGTVAVAGAVTQGSKPRVALGKTSRRIPSKTGILVSLCFLPAGVLLLWAANYVT